MHYCCKILTIILTNFLSRQIETHPELTKKHLDNLAGMVEVNFWARRTMLSWRNLLLVFNSAICWLPAFTTSGWQWPTEWRQGGRTNEQTDERMSGRTNGWMNGQTSERMNRRTNERTDGRIGRMRDQSEFKNFDILFRQNEGRERPPTQIRSDLDMKWCRRSEIT